MTHLTSDNIIEQTTQDRPAERTVVASLWKRESLLPSEEDLQQIIAAAESGARVAVICNLVADAQLIYTQLSGQAEWIKIDLFHSRFTFQDRQQREHEAVTAFGKGSQTEGAILVATQVVEQSLDLDFDWMVTQLAPVDLLFQRLGRLHRHLQRSRPTGFETPAVTLLLPEGLDFGGHGVIYANHRALWRTQQLLEQEDKLKFPEIYRRWIDTVYGVGGEEDQPWEDEPEEIIAAFDKYENGEDARHYSAIQISKSAMNPLADTDDNAAAMTRDGEMGINLCLMQSENILLDGTALSETEEWQQAEAVDRNTLSVPASWNRPNHPLLPEQRGEEIRKLILATSEEGWIGETKNATFFYTIEQGLTVERKEKTR